MRRPYLHRCHSKPKGVAKVAAARKLAVRLYWMMRTNTAYPEIVPIESSPRVEALARLYRAEAANIAPSRYWRGCARWRSV
jgi:hypothetical protein